MAPPLHQRWVVDQPFLDAKLKLGEGPYFEEKSNILRFVDIIQHQVHQVSLSEGVSTHSVLQLDVSVSFIAGIRGRSLSEKVLVGLKHGVALLCSKTGRYEYLAKLDLPDGDRIRTNDGAVGPDGSVWFGTMTDFGHDQAPEGALLRYRHGKIERVLEGLTVPNGIAWSPGNDMMYFVHSSAKQILAFRYSSGGDVSDRALLYQHDGPGVPDGLRVDVEGNLWVAFWGEGRVLRLSKAGNVTGEVVLPTQFATCPEFVGTELFITTAEDEEGEDVSRRYGGALFRVDVRTRGLPHNTFDLS